MRAVQCPFVVFFGLLLLGVSARAETTFIELGNTGAWKFYDAATPPPTGWQKADFDDAAWSAGPAPLGYGEADLKTTLNFGDDPNAKRTTAYFRRVLNVTDKSGIATLVFRVRYDDGLAVYLNGQEVLRQNLPDGRLEYQTFSTTRRDGPPEWLYRHFRVPAEALVAGRNVLAVEVHQCNPQSSDLVLDLALAGRAGTEDGRPLVKPSAREVVELYRNKHYVEPEVRLPDGFLDGGRQMRLEPDGRVQSGREVLCVDRPCDAALQRFARQARSEEVRKLAPADRARRLAALILQQCCFASQSPWILEVTNGLAVEYRNEAVLVGEVPRLCGATACRHRAILFKLLGDEAGLRAAMVRGYVRIGEKLEPHSWNEMILDDGTRMVVDLMWGAEKAVFPPSQADRYFTVDKQPYYTATRRPEE